MDVCLRELKESNKSRFDSYSVRNGVLIISHITFRGCGVHTFSDNLSWNSCIHSSVGSLGTDVTLWRNTMTKIFDRVFALERTRPLARTDLLLAPMQQVLTALRLFTTRTFEQVIGDLFGVSVLRSSRSLLQHGYSGQDGGKLEDLYYNSKPSISSWIHIFDPFSLKRVTSKKQYSQYTKSGVQRSPRSVFRKPWFSHTFSVIRQYENYRKCMEKLRFSKNWSRTSLHSRFGVFFLWTRKLLFSKRKHQIYESRKN